jgi:cell division protein FtsL
MARKSVSSRATGKTRGRRKGLNFRFFLVVCFILAGTGVFILVQHQFSVSCDLKSRRIDEQVKDEKAMQKSLRVSLARLKSPARVARIAQDDLDMAEPTGVIYLKYSRDEQGNLVCQSTFEKRSQPRPVPGKEKQVLPEATEEPSGSITRR